MQQAALPGRGRMPYVGGWEPMWVKVSIHVEFQKIWTSELLQKWGWKTKKNSKCEGSQKTTLKTEASWCAERSLSWYYSSSWVTAGNCRWTLRRLQADLLPHISGSLHLNELLKYCCLIWTGEKRLTDRSLSFSGFLQAFRQTCVLFSGDGIYYRFHSNYKSAWCLIFT